VKTGTVSVAPRFGRDAASAFDPLTPAIRSTRPAPSAGLFFLGAAVRAEAAHERAHQLPDGF